jgi:hypothetical protein
MLLSSAAANGHTEVLVELDAHKAKPSTQGEMPLHATARQGKVVAGKQERWQVGYTPAA